VLEHVDARARVGIAATSCRARAAAGRGQYHREHQTPRAHNVPPWVTSQELDVSERRAGWGRDIPGRAPSREAWSGSDARTPATGARPRGTPWRWDTDRKSTRLNSSHQIISYAVFC